MTVFLQKLRLRDAKKVGKKAAMLGELMRAGFRVPEGFVIPAKMKLTNAIIEAAKNLGVKKFAVRSSAPIEDGKKKSFAGQFTTVLNVASKDILKAIKRVRASGPKIAVIVQAMVQPAYAGVAFSKNPVTNDRNEIIIEAVRGLGEALVSGKKTPQRYIMNKRKLSGPLWIKQLAMLVKKLEQEFRYPVDIEWAFAKNQLYILQLRPITT